MRSLILLFTVFLMSLLVCSTAINPKRVLINRPTTESNIFKRSVQVKGAKPDVKGNHHVPSLNLRKGEYMCGNRVCKLQPGVIPKNCNGVCQYPV